MGLRKHWRNLLFFRRQMQRYADTRSQHDVDLICEYPHGSCDLSPPLATTTNISKFYNNLYTAIHDAGSSMHAQLSLVGKFHLMATFLL